MDELPTVRFDSFSRAGEAVAVGLGVIASRPRPGELADDELLAEELARCSDCARTPLIGEYVHLYESADVVCELCRVLRTQRPVSSARVTHSLGPARRNDPAVVVRITRV